MKKLLLIGLILTAIVFLLYKYWANPSKNSYTESSSCNCDKTWFPHDQTPNPLDDSTSNFEKLKDSTNNCMFHQFALQKFLWLTRTMKNGHAFFQDSLIQVNIKLDSIKPINGIALVLDDTLQASSNGTLRSNPTYAAKGNKPYTVYYSKFVNDKLYYACKKYADLLSRKDSMIQRDSNTHQFPNGSLETKASWINIDAIKNENQKNYYTTAAMVKVNGKYMLQTVALLGLHVATKVINHPEFIWATFQHHGLAPYHDWATKDTNTTANEDYLFFAKGTTYDIQGISWFNNAKGGDSILPTLNQAFSVYKYGTPVTIGKKYVDTSSQGVKGDSINYSNVDAINKSFNQLLANQSTDVWQNYLYNGAIWLNTDKLSKHQIDSLIHSLNGNIQINKGAPSRGSLAAMNITMETYRQVFKKLDTTQVTFMDIGNCLGCHNGQTTITDSTNGSIKGTSPLYFSHIFNHYLRSYRDTNRVSEEKAKRHDNLNDLRAFIKRKAKK